MAAVALVAASIGSIVVATRADAVPVPWKNCGSPSDPIAVQQFDTSVWPPQSGKAITVNLRFIVAHDIGVDHDELTMSPPNPQRVLRLLAPLRARRFAAGPHSSRASFRVPLKVQAGSVFSVHFAIFDRAGAQDFCLDMTVPIK